MNTDTHIKECALGELLSSLNSPDIFLVSASYEDRCLSISKQLKEKNQSEMEVAIFANEDSVPRTFENKEKLKHLFNDSKYFSLSKKDPIKTADSLIDLASWINSLQKKNILIDITCFTHEALLMLIKVLDSFLKSEVSITLCYNPAKEYDFSTQKNKWLSRGLREIRSVLGYAGDLSPSKDLHLIVLVGYDSERTLQLIDEYEPASISLGIGSKEPIEDHFLRENERFVNEIQAIHPKFETFHFSPSCPIQVSNEIKKNADKHLDKNIVLAPLNTKLSTIGVIRAIKNNPSIQVCYSLPIIYNTEFYSTPSDRCITIDLDEVLVF